MHKVLPGHITCIMIISSKRVGVGNVLFIIHGTITVLFTALNSEYLQLIMTNACL